MIHSHVMLSLQTYSDCKNDNYMAMVEGIQTFLANLGLVQYHDMFIMKGYDNEEDVIHLSDADLDEMMITDPDHRQIILQAAAQHRLSDQQHVLEWLRKHGLEYYYVNFLRSDRVSLRDIRHLELDDSVYEDLEIVLPGHQRRLQRAVSQLRKHFKTDAPAEQPLALGRWAKPMCLQDGKFDFLCVDATISSTKDSSQSYNLEFMVDTGSDVVTIRQEILEKLDLEVLGKIHSKGVHGSKTTNLFKANLLLGNQELEIEVMGESYDSIGSRVVRHFRHFIDGMHHVWLRGNFSDKDTKLQQTTSIPYLSQSSKPPLTCSTNSTPKSKSQISVPSESVPFTLNTHLPSSFDFSGQSPGLSNPDTAPIQLTIVSNKSKDQGNHDNDKYLKDTSPDELDM